MNAVIFQRLFSTEYSKRKIEECAAANILVSGWWLTICFDME